MRNIFENLTQDASANQTPALHRQPSKWDTSISDYHNHSVKSDADPDRELVHGSSTVFLVEDELPPPAYTRNIVAKFREMESSSVDNSVPLPGKTTSTPPRTTYNHSENRNIPSPVNRRRSTAEDDESDGSGADRGRSEKRSETYQRESSSSPRRSATSELPQEGTARSLLARWRTIEQQSSFTNEESRRRSSAAVKRSQSTSRIEVRQRFRTARPPARDDDDDDDDDDDGRRSPRYCNIIAS